MSGKFEWEDGDIEVEPSSEPEQKALMTIRELRNTPRAGFRIQSPDGSKVYRVVISPTSGTLEGDDRVLRAHRDRIIDEVEKLVVQGWRQPPEGPSDFQPRRPGMGDYYAGD